MEIEEEKSPGKIPQNTGEEQTLLMGDKKLRRAADELKDSMTSDGGVLSIPNEEAGNKCRSKHFIPS